MVLLKKWKMTNTIKSFYDVSVFLDSADISDIVKSVNYSAGLRDFRVDGKVRKSAIYQGAIHLKDEIEMPPQFVVEVNLSEGKWWFLVEFSYKGIGKPVDEKTIEISQMYWHIIKDANSILARFLRWAWRLFRK